MPRITVTPKWYSGNPWSVRRDWKTSVWPTLVPNWAVGVLARLNISWHQDERGQSCHACSGLRVYGWSLHRADERSVVGVRLQSVLGSGPLHTSGGILDIMGGHASRGHHPCYGHSEVFITGTPPVVATLPRVPGLPAFFSRQQSPSRRVRGHPRYVVSPFSWWQLEQRNRGVRAHWHTSRRKVVTVCPSSLHLMNEVYLAVWVQTASVFTKRICNVDALFMWSLPTKNLKILTQTHTNAVLVSERLFF